MADEKKSFILYTDLLEVVEDLQDDEAGKLFKHILRYVNDLDPQTSDKIISLLFIQIKQKLKRDLSSWQNTRLKRSESGKIGGKKSAEVRSKRKQKEAKGSNASKKEANEAVSVNVSVNDNVMQKKESVRENVFLFKKEIEKLKTQYSDEDVGWMFDKLSAYKLSKGRTYKSDYGAITSWVVDRLIEEKLKQKNSVKKDSNEQRTSELQSFIDR